jgi:uncharacterized protein YbjT (DUF2867 family)
MGDFLSMARSGRIWLFGTGATRINPIHGADLARAVVDTTEAGRGWLDVGGPEVFTQEEIAQLAFAALDRPRGSPVCPTGCARQHLQCFLG